MFKKIETKVVTTVKETSNTVRFEDEHGLDVDGFDAEGFDADGFDAWGTP